MASQNVQLQQLLATLNGTGNHENSSTQPTQSQARPGTHQESGPYMATGFSGIPGLGMLSSQRQTHTTSRELSIPEAQPALSRGSPQSWPSAKSATAASPVPDADTRPPSVPDASVITTWPAALKHVTKHLLQDDKTAQRIRSLITEQHDLEEQWWSKREAMEKVHAGRDQTSAALAEILRNVGGASTPSTSADAKADQDELEAYDKKVYKALVQMQAHFDKELRNLGVPFYAIKHDLVILEAGKEKPGSVQGRIDTGELRELQKRLLQTLEDLFDEENG